MHPFHPTINIAASVLLLSVFPSVTKGDAEHKVFDPFPTVFPTWKPNAIIDVGANKGLWTKTMHAIFPEAKFLMVEASEFHDEGLQQIATQELGTNLAERVIAVTSHRDGEQVDWFDTHKGSTGNSMFVEQTRFFDETQHKTTRTTAKLDTLRQNSLLLQNQRVDILKLDVQGAELVVLEGSLDILKEVTFVQLEASWVEYNRGQPCPFEIEDFLRRHGFLPYDLGDPQRVPQVYKTRGIGQIDVLYVRPDSPHLPREFQANMCGAGREAGPFLQKDIPLDLRDAYRLDSNGLEKEARASSPTMEASSSNSFNLRQTNNTLAQHWTMISTRELLPANASLPHILTAVVFGFFCGCFFAKSKHNLERRSQTSCW